MARVWIGLDVNLDDIVDSVAGGSNPLPHSEILNFILMIDATVAELDFTERLYAALGDVLREEYGADATD